MVFDRLNREFTRNLRAFDVMEHNTRLGDSRCHNAVNLSWAGTQSSDRALTGVQEPSNDIVWESCDVFAHTRYFN